MSPASPEALAAAVKAASPVAARIVGTPTGSVSSWLTLFTILSGLIFAYLKFIPKNRETISARANDLEEERRKDMEGMRGDIRELRTMVTDAVRTAQAAESRSSTLRAVVSMLTAEVQRLSPDNPVLAQAQAMVRDASSGDMGMGRGMSDIANKVAGLR